MASSYSLHKRDPRPGLFDRYDNAGSTNNTSTKLGGYAYSSHGTSYSSTPVQGSENSQRANGFPPAKRPFNHAMLDSLESQEEDAALEGIGSRIRALKDLSFALGKEIKESQNLFETMTRQYSRASGRLQGTMNRMLRAAASTGIGWKVWLGFFAAVAFLFWYVWL